MPPLRERQEDIPLLASHFLSLFATEMGREKPALSPNALSTLAEYPFPGNIRELKNIIERALIESDGATIEAEHLYFAKPPAATLSWPATLQKIEADPVEDSIDETSDYVKVPLNLEQAENLLLKYAFAKANGNIAQTARLLGTSRVTVYKRLAKVIDLQGE